MSGMRLKFWIGVGISAIAVGALVYRTDFGEMADAFRTAQYGWLLPGVGVALLLMVIRSWRWGYLLREELRSSFAGRLSATFIGFMANGLLPARMGEFIRAWCLGHREGTSKSAVFASIVVERLLDGLWILLYLVAAIRVVPFPDEDAIYWLSRAGVLSLVLYAGIIVFLVFLRNFPERTLRVLDVCLGPISRRFARKARDTLAGFIRGIYLPAAWGPILMMVFLTGLLWGFGLGMNYFTLLAFGLDLPWHAPLVLLVVQAIGVMVPSSPGFVGTFHAASVYGLWFYGVPEGTAFSYSVVVHIVGFAPVVLVGLVYLWKENLSLGRLAGGREGSPA
jgi:hypothetical protein